MSLCIRLQGESPRKRIAAVFALLLSLKQEAEQLGWEKFADVSIRQFSLLQQGLLREMPRLANVCHSRLD